jgi:uncharacterized membrane-anchored protein
MAKNFASGIFSLNPADLLKGGIVALLSAVLTSLQQVFTVTGGVAAINWHLVEGVAIATGISYLLKNLATNSQGEVAGIAATATPPVKG